MRPLFYAQLIFVLFACRPKPKPNVLALIPPDTPVVAWLPAAGQSLAAIDRFLSVFDAESLGDQLKAMRYDYSRQLGFDPFDSRQLTAHGFEPSDPWAAADEGDGFVFFLPTTDNTQAFNTIAQIAKDTLGAQQTRSEDDVTVFSEPFGTAHIDDLAVRKENKALVVALGPGCLARLKKWPHAKDLAAPPDNTFHNFQQLWKKAESDGSIAGVAARAVIRGSALSGLGFDAPASVPVSTTLNAYAGVQTRVALIIDQSHIEAMTVVLGLDPEKVRAWFAPPAQRGTGVGLPERPFLWAHSALKPELLLRALRGAPLLRSVTAFMDKQASPGKIDQLAALTTGNADVAVEIDPNAPFANKARLDALLDLFPGTVLAELKNPAGFDAELPSLQTMLTQRGFAATLDTQHTPPTLRSPSARVGLSRRAQTLVYGIGPNAFDRALDRLAKGNGIAINEQLFAPLAHPQTSGVVMNFTALTPLLDKAPQMFFGDQNQMVKTFVGRTLKSFTHFQSAGLTLSLEGPAYEPHPTLRVWLQTQR